MKIKLVVFFILYLLAGGIWGDTKRDMPPLGYEWRECKVGMVINCKTTECDSICASNLSAEKEEKEIQRLEETKEIIKQGTAEGLQESKEMAQPQ